MRDILEISGGIAWPTLCRLYTNRSIAFEASMLGKLPSLSPCHVPRKRPLRTVSPTPPNPANHFERRAFQPHQHMNVRQLVYSRSRGRDEYPLMAKLGRALQNFVRYR